MSDSTKQVLRLTYRPTGKELLFLSSDKYTYKIIRFIQANLNDLLWLWVVEPFEEEKHLEKLRNRSDKEMKLIYRIHDLVDR